MIIIKHSPLHSLSYLISIHRTLYLQNNWSFNFVGRFLYKLHFNSLFSLSLSACHINEEKLSKINEKLLQKKIRKEDEREKRISNQKLKLTSSKKKIKDTALQIDLPNVYKSSEVESKLYNYWMKNDLFNSDNNKIKPKNDDSSFVICLPPPNITGSLHLGHCLGGSIQDAIIRRMRMVGKHTLWIPGCDHAGIATQVVVEKMLQKQADEKLLTTSEGELTPRIIVPTVSGDGLVRNISDKIGVRHELGRERFLDEVWKWKEKYGNNIYLQLKSLGYSLDWNRACFTLDPIMCRAVDEAFIHLFEEGLIHRKKRLVNWSCALRSAISDIEVDNVELEGSTYLDVPSYNRKICFGTLSTFLYPIHDSPDNEKIAVSTTRLETMLGDVAIAIHPSDLRYQHLIGKSALHPLCNRIMPIVCDDMVEPSMGTGAVKITPAHDPIDFELAKRHNLPFINILDDWGCMLNVPNEFLGKKRYDIRSELLEILTSMGLFKDVKDHKTSLPMCSRSRDIVEPVIREQWFMDCKLMAQDAIEAVASKKLELVPNRYNTMWMDWLTNIKEWCISRQLWWGHKIPAYAIFDKSSMRKEPVIWVAALNSNEAVSKASEKLNMSVLDLKAIQDEDVLDTWFSSAIYPFSIFGWPEKSSEMKCYYPTNLLVTANDIIFFWVTRMVMLGLKLTNQLPFKQVLFHAIIQDAHGRKMSKSLGNVIDPLHIINGLSLENLLKNLENSNLNSAEKLKARRGLEKDFPLGIKQSGSDALRFTLLSYNYMNSVVNVDITHIESNEHFCNKIWQAYRFVRSKFDRDENLCKYQRKIFHQQLELLSHTDKWLLFKLTQLVKTVNSSFNNYELFNAARALQNFWTKEFCSVYLEYSKISLNKPKESFTNQDLQAVNCIKYILVYVFDTWIRLAHPFMPFITEEIYLNLNGHRDIDKFVESICLASYPLVDEFKIFDNLPLSIEREMDFILQLVSQFASFKMSSKHLKSSLLQACIIYSDEKHFNLLENYLDTFKALTKMSSLKHIQSLEELPPRFLEVELEKINKSIRMFLVIEEAV